MLAYKYNSNRASLPVERKHFGWSLHAGQFGCFGYLDVPVGFHRNHHICSPMTSWLDNLKNRLLELKQNLIVTCHWVSASIAN